MSQPKYDPEIETELDIWWRVTKEVYGKNTISKTIGAGIFQNGFEYAKEIIAYVNGIEVSKYKFELPNEEEVKEYDKAA